jgi:uncharacterized protein YkwD
MKLASQIEKVLFATHNQMRTDPKSFVPIMENAIRNFESPTSTLLKRIGRPDLSTEEGVNAWIEAKNAFITQPPLPPLQWSDALSLAAQDHCSDVGGKGVVSHDGSDGSKVWHRMERYGKGSGTLGENLSFGNSWDDEYMTSLWVDDGVVNRGHRHAITQKAYRKVGIAFC